MRATQLDLVTIGGKPRHTIGVIALDWSRAQLFAGELVHPSRDLTNSRSIHGGFSSGGQSLSVAWLRPDGTRGAVNPRAFINLAAKLAVTLFSV